MAFQEYETYEGLVNKPHDKYNDDTRNLKP